MATAKKKKNLTSDLVKQLASELLEVSVVEDGQRILPRGAEK